MTSKETFLHQASVSCFWVKESMHLIGEGDNGNAAIKEQYHAFLSSYMPSSKPSLNQRKVDSNHQEG